MFLIHGALAQPAPAQEWKTVSMKQDIDSVAPWTGIVLWSAHEKNETDSIQLEFSYMSYRDVAVSEGKYDWSAVESVLAEITSRGHQAVLRFHYVYPGKPSTVPEFIKGRTGYREIWGKSEGKKTEFVDWSSQGIQEFTLDFHTAFAKRFDDDPRLAYLQTGFGLWGEYHIYSGPRKIGETFPSKEFQSNFLKHMNDVFQSTPWTISVDAADGDYSPFEQQPELQNLQFGLFDDSFLSKQHPKYNAKNWEFFGSDRWKESPGGGEFSYYNKKDQKLALSKKGPNGRSFEDSAAQFHVSFMIGNDQPQYQSMERIEQAGIATGYRMRVTQFETNGSKARVSVTNTGIAPMYHDAYLTIDGVRSQKSLRGLLPGKSIQVEISHSSEEPKLTIESDRLVPGQSIPFAAE
jgi:hypothetical protein